MSRIDWVMHHDSDVWFAFEQLTKNPLPYLIYRNKNCQYVLVRVENGRIDDMGFYNTLAMAQLQVQ